MGAPDATPLFAHFLAAMLQITNFYRGLKGKFKVPTFAHKELDLYAVRAVCCR